MRRAEHLRAREMGASLGSPRHCSHELGAATGAKVPDICKLLACSTNNASREGPDCGTAGHPFRVMIGGNTDRMLLALPIARKEGT